MVTLTGVQGFTELARQTLGSANAQISVTGLPARQWLLILCDLRHTASLFSKLRINNVSTSTYSFRNSVNGAADTTSTSQTAVTLGNSESTNSFVVIWIETLSTGEKLIQAWTVGQSGVDATTAPDRQEHVSKWADTSSAITEIDILTSTSTFATGSEVVVLGSDPGDFAVTPFFTELGRTELASSNASISLTPITAMKYLMVVFGIAGRSTSTNVNGFQFNGDSGSNYSDRFSSNGAVDVADTSKTVARDTQGPTVPETCFIFILNISANLKLFISFCSSESVAGAATAPDRFEAVGKWVNTSSQITRIDNVILTSGTYNAGTKMIVYGSN